MITEDACHGELGGVKPPGDGPVGGPLPCQLQHVFRLHFDFGLWSAVVQKGGHNGYALPRGGPQIAPNRSSLSCAPRSWTNLANARFWRWDTEPTGRATASALSSPQRVRLDGGVDHDGHQPTTVADRCPPIVRPESRLEWQNAARNCQDPNQDHGGHRHSPAVGFNSRASHQLRCPSDTVRSASPNHPGRGPLFGPPWAKGGPP